MDRWRKDLRNNEAFVRSIDWSLYSTALSGLTKCSYVVGGVDMATVCTNDRAGRQPRVAYQTQTRRKYLKAYGRVEGHVKKTNSNDFFH